MRRGRTVKACVVSCIWALGLSVLFMPRGVEVGTLIHLTDSWINTACIKYFVSRPCSNYEI